jgi:hypothetical protein
MRIIHSIIYYALLCGKAVFSLRLPDTFAVSANKGWVVKQNTPFLRDKRVISISPGAYKGFYMMGVASYINDHYDLEQYVFSGASAGAWISLLMCYRGPLRDVMNTVMNSNISTVSSIIEMENHIANCLLQKYTADDFDLRRLFVGITVPLFPRKMVTYIVTDFDTLDDAIRCCIASSHIPVVSGSLLCRYRGMICFDGGFSRFPYLLHNGVPIIHITPTIWKGVKRRNIWSHIVSLFVKGGVDGSGGGSGDVSGGADGDIFSRDIERGYKDTRENRHRLDDIFGDNKPRINNNVI